MKRILLFFFLLCSSEIFAQTLEELNAKKITLPNGWHLTPVGKSLQLGDLPLNMVVSRSGKYIAVTNNGQSTLSIQLIDAKAEKLLDDVTVPKSWYGLKFSADERVGNRDVPTGRLSHEFSN